MTRWLLVRHGETVWNREGRYQGHLDIPLADVGREQAVALGAALASVQIAAAFFSDLSRAADTARLALQDRDLKLAATPHLRETLYGQWEGLTFREARERDPELFARLLRWEPGISPPGGESVDQVLTRVKAFVASVEPQDGDATVLVVAHSGSLRVLAGALMGLPPEATRRFALDNASLSVVETHPRGSALTLWNDPSHYRRHA